MDVTIFKPPILKRMDKLSRNPKLVRKALQDAQKRKDTSLVELGLLHGYLQKKGPQAAHLRDDMFDQTKGWWAGRGNIEAVTRKALIKAGQLAVRYNLPTDSYCVLGGDKFEVVICRSDRQLTLLFRLPFPPPAPGGRPGGGPIRFKLGVPTNVQIVS